MIEIVGLNDMSENKRERLMRRSTTDIEEVKPMVSEVLRDVKNDGDKALKWYTNLLDGVQIEDFRVTEKEIEEAFERTPPGLIERMKEQIGYSTEFHKRQVREDWKYEVAEGITLGEKFTPIESVGLYIPGGRAAYPSVLQILGVAAKMARVPRIVVCTPPMKDGKVPDAVLAVARLLDIGEIYRAGGAQAIAALAYGTESIEPVMKIAGPGNIYVNCAKMLVFGTVDIDMPAGPSEALIIADEKAEPAFVAADILARCEHDPKASAVMLTVSLDLAENVKSELARQVGALNRKDVITASLKDYSAIIVCDSREQMVGFANDFAPEHLELLVENPWDYQSKIVNAGSIFLGNYAPVAVGDYASGTNHVLPTGQFAKMFSPVSVDTFLKRTEFQFVTKDGLRKLEPIVREVSKVEGLDGHYKSVEVRL